MREGSALAAHASCTAVTRRMSRPSHGDGLTYAPAMPVLAAESASVITAVVIVAIVGGWGVLVAVWLMFFRGRE